MRLSGSLIQDGFRYSFQDDDFQGGRTFEATNARLSFRGTVDGRFYYRAMFNMLSEPNLLDAFAGYYHNDGLRITAGAMKPRQTLDFMPNPGETDFIDRAKITGLLVQSREIGISAVGDVENFHYYAGIFNRKNSSRLCLGDSRKIVNSLLATGYQATTTINLTV